MVNVGVRVISFPFSLVMFSSSSGGLEIWTTLMCSVSLTGQKLVYEPLMRGKAHALVNRPHPKQRIGHFDQ